jgi:hypothetical protein
MAATDTRLADAARSSCNGVRTTTVVIVPSLE